MPRSVFVRIKGSGDDWDRFVGTIEKVDIIGYPLSTILEYDNGSGIKEITVLSEENTEPDP